MNQANSLSCFPQEYRESDPEQHFQYFRMSKERFDELLAIVGPRIAHAKMHRIPISPAEQLCLTLYILASGASQSFAHKHFRIGRRTVVVIVRETPDALWHMLDVGQLGSNAYTRLAKSVRDQFKSLFLQTAK